MTTQVVAERRLSVLRDLSLRAGAVLDVGSALDGLREVLGGAREDLPFAALYLQRGDVLERELVVGRAADGSDVADVLPVRVADGDEDPWRLRAGQGPREVPKHVVVTGGPWDDRVTTALALPLASADPGTPLGVLLVGTSPARALDASYTSFFDVLGQQVAATLRKAQAYDEERRRAEALAELDRAKTLFFTNVSHEFRTPLTLMLGPLEDALADPEPLPLRQVERLDTAHRNAQRLLRLVNDLLSFSTLEAGQRTVDAQPVDLAAVTRDHASAFRAAVERAGLELVVDTPPLPRPVRLDPAHWETVVTNLLSNALKFTFTGRIEVRLRDDGDAVVLEVEDTGIGVPQDQLGALFERFSRVSGSRSRSHEGSGIGLALVAELVRLHGGDVAVRSTVGEGTAFSVRLPWAQVQAPAGEAVVPSGTGRAASAAAEALAWTDGDAPLTAGTVRHDPELAGARVLVADDNRDMRGYLVRLLQDAGCEVAGVADGAAALRALHETPVDLLLTDVMMPELDGFELLRAVRQDPALATLPIVVLSARAGGEAGVEGLDLGADDYLVKPFRAEELLARLRSTLRLARLRSAHAAQLTAVAETTAVLAAGRPLPASVLEVLEQARALLGVPRLRAVLHGRGPGPLADVVTPEPSAEPPDAVLDVALDDAVHGRLEVWGRPDPDRTPLLAPVTTVLGALVVSGGQAERDREVAVALQRALLPERLPDVPGLELAAAYLPASSELQVGGDWYDVQPLPDGRVLLAVGDAAGHGLAAAVAMGQLRDAVRAYALEDPDPARALSRVDALTAALGTTPFATVWLGVLDPATGELEWCSAGHVAPAVLLPDAEPAWLLGDTAPAVGTGGGAHRSSRTVLPEGARLLLYTDGLVEERETQLDSGPRELRERLAAAADSAGALVDAALRTASRERADDVAVLALRRTGEAPALALTAVDELRTYPAEPASAARVRRDLRASLLAAGVPEDEVFAVLLAATEAVANAVEHAQAPTRPEVEVRVVVDDRSCRVVVQDFGSWLERPPAMDRGRGSTLMASVGEVRVVPSGSGTTVTIERSLTGGPL